MKKILLFIFLTFIFINISALTYGGCDYSTVSRMKSIVSNINFSYDYQIINNEAYFSVTINNLTNDIYFYDNITKRNYYFSDSNNGEITISNYKVNSGNYKFYSNNSSCYGIALGTKYYNFPKYNIFHTHELCLDIPNYSLCKKWANVNYSAAEFEEKVLEYKNKKNEIQEEEIKVEYEKTFVDILVDIYINYYYYILGCLIIVCMVIIVVSNKKNKFKL